MQAQTNEGVGQSLEANAQPVVNRYHGTGVSDKERYRRSSLCLIMLTHRDKKYAEGMERVFRNFPLPLRYNEHNISDLRVIAVKGKQEKSDIDKIVTHPVELGLASEEASTLCFELRISLDLLGK